jgi:hypothetical protein
MDVGLAFFLLGAFYVVSNPVSGWVKIFLKLPS